MPSSNVSRRQLMRAGAALPALASAQPAATSNLPNFLFIISDDHSFPDLGCYGNEAIRTPNLDRLAREGCRYDRCFVSSPQCSPNRSSILTGCAPHTTSTSRLHTPLPDWEPSILEPLKERGYFTGAFRKVHQGPDFDKRWNFYGDAKELFDKFFEALPQGKPFYLHVGFTDPHRPYSPGAVAQPHDPAKVKIPSWLPDTPAIRADLADYYDEISRMDTESGQVLALLEKHGLSQNTLVIFTGDNGMPFPPRGKGTLYESGIKVPFLARWPGHIPAGGTSSKLVAHVDLPVTWLAAAGIPKPSKMQGVDFLRGSRDQIFSERNWHDNFDLARCVRTDRYKLIFNGLPGRPFRPIGDLESSPTWASFIELGKADKLVERHRRALDPARPLLELYDLQADPDELVNLAQSEPHAKIREDLTKRLTGWMNATYDFLPPPFREFPPNSGIQRPTL